jgi:hypothetical protein
VDDVAMRTVLGNTVRTMRRLIPTSPQARAVVGLVAVMAVAVVALGVLSTGPGERAEIVPAGEESAATTSTTRASTTTPATVLGAVIERDDEPEAEADAGDDSPPVATTTAAPPATAAAPTAPPATAAPPPPTSAPPATEAPTTTTEPAPIASTVQVTVQVRSTSPIEVVLRGGDVVREVLLPPEGGSATFADLPRGTYQLSASWTVGPPADQDPDGPQVGPSGQAAQSSPFGLAPGDRLTAILDADGWTLVLG